MTWIRIRNKNMPRTNTAVTNLFKEIKRNNLYTNFYHFRFNLLFRIFLSSSSSAEGRKLSRLWGKRNVLWIRQNKTLLLTLICFSKHLETNNLIIINNVHYFSCSKSHRYNVNIIKWHIRTVYENVTNTAYE